MRVLHLVHDYLPTRMIWLYRLIESHIAVTPSVFSFETRPGHPPVAPCHRSLADFYFLRLFNHTCFRLLGRFPMVEGMVKSQRIDVMHGHFGNFSYRFLGSALATKVPLVTSFYGRDMSRLAQKRKHRRRYLRLFEKGARFIVEGPAARDTLIKLGCPGEKIRVVHFGIYPDQIPFRKREYAPGECFEILMAAGLAEKKGHKYALAAVAQLVEKGADVHLTLIGSGNGETRIREAIAGQNLGDHVTLMPGVSYADLLAQMHRSHVFLHPSVTASSGDTEGGAPVVLLDAMASGLPIVSSLHADIPTIVPHGRGGLLAPEKDVGRLVEYLERLMQNPDELSEFSVYSRQHVEAHHDWHVQIEKIEAVYRECVPMHGVGEKSDA